MGIAPFLIFLGFVGAVGLIDGSDGDDEVVEPDPDPTPDPDPDPDPDPEPDPLDGITLTEADNAEGGRDITITLTEEAADALFAQQAGIENVPGTGPDNPSETSWTNDAGETVEAALDLGDIAAEDTINIVVPEDLPYEVLVIDDTWFISGPGIVDEGIFIGVFPEGTEVGPSITSIPEGGALAVGSTPSDPEALIIDDEEAEAIRDEVATDLGLNPASLDVDVLRITEAGGFSEVVQGPQAVRFGEGEGSLVMDFFDITRTLEGESAAELVVVNDDDFFFPDVARFERVGTSVDDIANVYLVSNDATPDDIVGVVIVPDEIDRQAVLNAIFTINGEPTPVNQTLTTA